MVEELSGHRSRLQQVAYRAEVFHLLRYGGTARARDGETLVIPPHDDISGEPHVGPAAGRAARHAAVPRRDLVRHAAGQQVGARAQRADPEIVVHDTEDGWDGSVATLQYDGGKSVHYIIDADGSRVGQFRPETDTAWHAGN